MESICDAAMIVFLFSSICPAESSRKFRDANGDRGCENQSLNVTISYELLLIRDLDETQQTISLNHIIRLAWQDETLIGGQGRRYISVRDIPCMPQMYMVDSIESHAISSERSALKAVVNKHGQVLMALMRTDTFSCPLDMTYYPFDEQFCAVTFVSAMMGSDLDIWPMRGGTVAMGFYRQNQEWDLQSTIVRKFYIADEYVNTEMGALVFGFTIRRWPLYYIVNLVIPSTLVGLVTVAGFFTAVSASGSTTDKVQKGLMALLAIVIQLETVSKDMPVTSGYVPILSWYYLNLVLIIASGMSISIIILQSYHDGLLYHRAPSQRWAVFLFFHVVKAFCLANKVNDVMKQSSRETMQPNDHINLGTANSSTQTELHTSSNTESADEGDTDFTTNVVTNKMNTKTLPHYLTSAGAVSLEIQWQLFINVLEKSLLVFFEFAVCTNLVWFLSYYRITGRDLNDHVNNYINKINHYSHS